MMRVLFLFCLSFCFLKADAQLPWNYPGAGIRMKKMISDSVAQIPSDTTNNKTGIASIGSTLYVGNGTKWTAAVSGATTVIDSVTFVSSTCADTVKYWISGVSYYSGVIDRVNGLLNGGEVELVDSTMYNVFSAVYRLSCVRYRTNNQTVLLNKNTSGQPRIDIIGVNTSSTAFVRQGIPAANPQTPSVDPLTEIGLVSVYFPANSDTATIVNIYNNYTFEGTDSTAFHNLTQLNDTTAIWCDLQGRCDTLVLRRLGGDGLLSGGTVTKVGAARFFADSAFYQLQGIRYASDTLTFNVTIGDTARIDRVVADTSGSVVVITGVEGLTPAIPSINVATQVDLGFIYVAPDTVYISTPTQPNYWTLVGNRLQNNTGTSVQLSLGNTSLLVDNNYTNVPRLFSNNSLRIQANATSGSRTIIGTEGGNIPVGTTELEVKLGDVSGVNGDKIAQSITGRLLHSSGTQNTTFLSITPTINQSGGTGEIIGIKYSPTVTDVTGTHYALRTTAGDIFTTGSRNVGLWTEDMTGDKTAGLYLNSSNPLASLSTYSLGGSAGVSLQDTVISLVSGSQSGITKNLELWPDSVRLVNEVSGQLMFPNIPTGRDTLATVRQVRDRYIVRADSGIVVNYVGDTAKISVDTAYLKNVVHPYKSYVAKLSQSGTNPPVANIIYNDLGNITWSRLDVGSYLAELSGSFQPEKTFIINQVSYGVPLNGQLGLVYTTYVDADSIGVKSVDAFVSGDSPFSDDIIYDTYIEIRVYN